MGSSHTRVYGDLSVDRFPADQGTAQQRSSNDRLPFRLSTGPVGRLRKLAREQSVSPFAIVLGGWAVVLSRWSGQEDIALRVRAINHAHRDAEPLTCVLEYAETLRIRVQPAATFGQLLTHVT